MPLVAAFQVGVVSAFGAGETNRPDRTWLVCVLQSVLPKLVSACAAYRELPSTQVVAPEVQKVLQQDARGSRASANPETRSNSVLSLERGDCRLELNDRSGVNREIHAPFREGPGVKLPRSTRPHAV